MRSPLSLTVSSLSSGQSKRLKRRKRNHLPQPTRQSTTDTVIPTSPAEDSVPAAPDQPQFFPIGSVTADLISCETV